MLGSTGRVSVAASKVPSLVVVRRVFYNNSPTCTFVLHCSMFNKTAESHKTSHFKPAGNPATNWPELI